MANPFPFTIGQVLLASELNGIGEAFASYTPTVTSSGGTITTVGAVTGRFTRVNKIVFVYFSVIVTTVGTATGQLRVTMPIARGANVLSDTVLGTARDRDVSGEMMQILSASSTAVGLLKVAGGSVFSLGDGISVRGSFFYEVD